MTWTRSHTIAALTVLLTTTGCGPTEEQIALTTLVALPIAMSAAMLGTFALRRVWGDEVSFPVWGIATIIVGFVTALALAQSRHFDGELFGPVLMFTSSAATGFSLLFARMRLAAPAERSVVLVPLLVACLLALPFASRLLVGKQDEVMTAGILAIVGGFYLAPVVFVGLVIERVIRARRATRLHPGSVGSPSDPSDLGR